MSYDFLETVVQFVYNKVITQILELEKAADAENDLKVHSRS